MLRFLLLQSVITWNLVQNTAGNLLGIGGGAGSSTWYPPQPQPGIVDGGGAATWYPPQPQPGIVDGGGAATWYPPQPPPFRPPPPPQPVVENPVCLEWGNNAFNPAFPFPLGPVIGGGGVVEQEVGGCSCNTYSIRVCPLASAGCEIVEQQEGGQEIVEEVIDKTFIDEGTGRVIAEEREVVEVKNPFFPNYSPYGPSYPYFPPSQPSYPFYPPPINSGFQTGASRSLGEE